MTASISEINQARRKLLGVATVMAVAPRLAWAKAVVPTPRQTAGPFYPEEFPFDDDNDLTRVSGRKDRAKGDTTDLFGRILDTNGRPLSGARVEIWQCDANGRYHHPGDNRRVPLDESFQGHGHTLTDATGSYRFLTILPVPYPGRTPHIHAAVFLPEQRPFVTQIYIEGEPRNAEDSLYRRIPVEKRALVTAAFKPTAGAKTQFSAEFQVVVGITPKQA